MAGRRSDRVTIIEVAARAGVSTATAGRVLGGYGYASADIQSRVQAAAESLGYRANHLARGLITGKTDTIGVVAGDIESPFYASVLRGIADVARAEGFGVLVTNTDENLERECEAVKLLLEKQVDGLIVSPCRIEQVEHLRQALSSACPIVQIDRASPALAAASVTIDNLEAARCCVAALIEAGHVRIGLIADLQESAQFSLASILASPALPEPGRFPPAWQRLLGYVVAHREAGLAVETTLVPRVEAYRAEAARLATTALLDAPGRPQALFTTDGLMSVGAMQAISSLGLAVPGDISLICFDDLDWMSFVGTGITAVAQPAQQLGRTAADLLVQRIRGVERPIEHRVLDAVVNHRNSVRPLHSGGRPGGSAGLTRP